MEIFDNTREFLLYYLKFLHKENLTNENIGKIYNHIYVLIANLDKDLNLFKEALYKKDYDSDYNQFFRIALLHKHLAKTNKCEKYNTFNLSLCYLLLNLQQESTIDDVSRIEGKFKDYLEELLLPRAQKDPAMFNNLNQGFLNKVNATFHASTKEKSGCNLTIELLNKLINFFEIQINLTREKFKDGLKNFFLELKE